MPIPIMGFPKPQKEDAAKHKYGPFPPKGEGYFYCKFYLAQILEIKEFHQLPQHWAMELFPPKVSSTYIQPHFTSAEPEAEQKQYQENKTALRASVNMQGQEWYIINYVCCFYQIYT